MSLTSREDQSHADNAGDAREPPETDLAIVKSYTPRRKTT